MYKNILTNGVKFKSDTQCSELAKDFIFGLLIKDPQKRLGSIADSLEVMSHPWFADFDWKQLVDKKLEPPYNPLKKEEDWIKNFDPNFTRQEPIDSICKIDPKFLDELNKQFDEFHYFEVEGQNNNPTSEMLLEEEQTYHDLPSNSSSGENVLPINVLENTILVAQEQQMHIE